MLQFLENLTGVREPNITEWRRKTFGDLKSTYLFVDATAKPPVLPSTSGLVSFARFGASSLPKPDLPAAEQQMPKQEPGKRNRLKSEKG